jgi:hypothetical protein
VNPRTASDGGAWELRTPLFLQSRWPPLQFLDFWRVCFVIFTCWNMYLNYC